MRKKLIPALAALMLAAALPGCGDDSEIPKSENAPTQADFDAMKDMMNKSAKKAPKKAK